MSSSASGFRPRPVRRFSETSDKQIAQAAMRGRLVTFKYLGTQPPHEVVGYVVGMDDYHWMVVSVVPSIPVPDSPVAVSLVHKSRADLIHLHPLSTLDQEREDARTAIQTMGSAFWTHCKTTYGSSNTRSA